MATTPVKKRFSYTVRDFYRFFKKDKKAEGNPTEIEYKVYKAIVEAFFRELMGKIIAGKTFTMPFKLGLIYIASIDVTNLKNRFRIDYAATKKLGKTVRWLNQKTGKIAFRFKWFKQTVTLKNKQFYEFCPVARKSGVGRQGLMEYIEEVSSDPNRKSYIKK